MFGNNGKYLLINAVVHWQKQDKIYKNLRNMDDYE